MRNIINIVKLLEIIDIMKYTLFYKNQSELRTKFGFLKFGKFGLIFFLLRRKRVLRLPHKITFVVEQLNRGHNVLVKNTLKEYIRSIDAFASGFIVNVERENGDVLKQVNKCTKDVLIITNIKDDTFHEVNLNFKSKFLVNMKTN